MKFLKGIGKSLVVTGLFLFAIFCNNANAQVGKWRFDCLQGDTLRDDPSCHFCTPGIDYLFWGIRMISPTGRVTYVRHPYSVTARSGYFVAIQYDVDVSVIIDYRQTAFSTKQGMIDTLMSCPVMPVDTVDLTGYAKTGVGTPGVHAKYADADSLVNSIISDDGSVATVIGGLAVNNVAMAGVGDTVLTLNPITNRIEKRSKISFLAGYPTGGGVTNEFAWWNNGVLTSSNQLLRNANRVEFGTLAGLKSYATGSIPIALSEADLFYNATLKAYGGKGLLTGYFPFADRGTFTANRLTYTNANGQITESANYVADGTNIIVTGGGIDASTGRLSTGGGGQRIVCDHPSDATRYLGGAGALEITLPSFPTGQSIAVAFDVVLWQYNGYMVRFTVYFRGDTSPGAAQAWVTSNGIFLDGRAWRVGHSGGRYKVWLGELTTDYTFVAATVENVNITLTGTTGNIGNICTGWSIAQQSSAFGTVNRSGTVVPQVSRITASLGEFTTNTINKDMSAIFAGFYNTSSTVGALRVSLPASNSALANKTIRFQLKGSYVSAINGNFRDFTIQATYNYQTLNFSNCRVDWGGSGAPITIRFGDESSIGRIWFGETSATQGALYLYDVTTHVLDYAAHGSFAYGFGITSAVTSFGNIDVTVSADANNAIPVFSLSGQTNLYSNLLSYSGTQFRANNYIFNADQAVGAGQNGYALTWNNTTGEFEATLGDSIGRRTFLALNDTPDSYTGQADKQIRVNASETALEFYLQQILYNSSQSKAFLNANTYDTGAALDYNNNGNWLGWWGIAKNRGQFFDVGNVENLDAHEVYLRVLSARGNANIGLQAVQANDYGGGIILGQKVSGSGDQYSGGYSYYFQILADRLGFVDANNIRTNVRFKQRTVNGLENALSFLYNTRQLSSNYYDYNKAFTSAYRALFAVDSNGVWVLVDPATIGGVPTGGAIGDVLMRDGTSSTIWTKYLTNSTNLRTFFGSKNFPYAMGRDFGGGWEGGYIISDGRFYAFDFDNGNECAKVFTRSARGNSTNLQPKQKNDLISVFGDETKVSGTGNQYIQGWSNSYALYAVADSITADRVFPRIGLSLRTYLNQGNNYDFTFLDDAFWATPNRNAGSDFYPNTRDDSGRPTVVLSPGDANGMWRVDPINDLLLSDEVALNDLDYSVATSFKSGLVISLGASSSATSDSQVLLPAASSMHVGKTIQVVSFDESGTYAVALSGGTNEIYANGVNSNSYTLIPGEVATVICVKNPISGAYKWAVK